MSFNISGGAFYYGNGSPIANGALTLTLVGGPATIIATGGAAPSSYTFNLDSNGVIQGIAQVYGNAELSPAGTYYVATVTHGGSTVWGPVNWAVGPSALYAGTLFPAVLVLPAFVQAGSPSVYSFVTKTANYSATTSDVIIVMNSASAVTLTLPVAGASAGQIWWVINIGAGLLTIQGATGTIGGAASVSVKQGASVGVVYDGANFQVIQ